MADDLSDLINSFKNMADNGNVPNNIKEILTKMNNNSTNSETSNVNNSTNGNNVNENNYNIDVETMLKMKSIINSMNKKDDPRANLLYSLKPYLRESRKDKLDQYINLLNMTKIADIMKNDGKESNNNA